MSEQAQAFEILCPVCRQVVPREAHGCPNCAKTPSERAVVVAKPQIAALPLKDYHELVRANHWAVEGGRYVEAGGGFRFRTYLPFLLLLIVLIVGGVMASGRV
jgi:hypothetical protein